MFDTEAFKTTQIVSIYNTLAAVLSLATVDRFSDRATAEKRVTGLYAKVEASGKVVTVDESGGVTLADKPAPQPVSDLPVQPPVAVEPAPAERRTASTKVRVKVAKSKTKKAKRASSRVPVASVADTDVIIVIHEGDNPKKANAALRFALYQTGMTVGGYIDGVAGLRLDPPARAQALRDLAWDTRQGWVQVVGAAFYAEVQAREVAAEEKKAA